MESLLLDLRFAARSLRKSPGFTAVAVATLALGIGANATLFSVLHGVLLNPLPYPHADRLAVVWNQLGAGGAQDLPAVSVADFHDYPAMIESFDELAAASGARAVGLSGILTGDGAPEKVDLSPVTANFFPLFGIDPALGRHFTLEEEVFEGPKVALLSHELWQRRFGGDPDLVGDAIEIDGQPWEVVGVLPEGFRLLLPAEAFLLKHSDVWVPLQVDYANPRPRNFTTLSVFGRLAEGATFAGAQEEMERVAAELRLLHPVHAASNLQIRAVPLQQDVVKGVRPALVTLMGAVGFVLLIVCANVANLLLVRGAGRSREIAVQAALGAGWARLVRRLLAESLLLAGLGGAFAVGVAYTGLAVLQALRPSSLPRLGEIGIDATVLAFTAGTALATALVFGLVPASQGTRVRLVEALRADGRTAGGRGQSRLSTLLVVGEVGLSLVLLVGVGLMIQSFAALARVDPGFEPEGVLTFGVELPRADYPERENRTAFFDAFEEGLRGLPGVRCVGTISQLPLSGSGPLQPYAYDEETARNWESVTADGRWVTREYFEAMGIRLIAGRTLERSDAARQAAEGERPGAPPLVIDEVVARRAFSSGRAVGGLLQVEPSDSEQPYGQVVGVVEHVRAHDLSRRLWGQIYRAGWGGRSMRFAVKTDADPEGLVGPVRELLARADPGLPLIDPRPMTASVYEASAQARFSLLLMSLFGFLALVLVALGIYGVVSSAVGARRREMAIRLALGEAPGRLARQVLGQGLALVAVAALLGVAASLVLSRFLGDLLYEVSPTDPLSLVAAAAVLGAVALVASYLPARRAASVHPAAVLREE